MGNSKRLNNSGQQNQPDENRYYRRLRRKIDRHLALRRQVDLYRSTNEPFSREEMVQSGEYTAEELDDMETVYRFISEKGGMLMYPDGIE